MLVKWLDKSRDDRLSDFGILPDYGDFYQRPPMIGGRWGESASDIVLCDADYGYILDWYVVRDQWDTPITTGEPFTGIMLWVSPDKRKSVADETLRVPNELQRSEIMRILASEKLRVC